MILLKKKTTFSHLWNHSHQWKKDNKNAKWHANGIHWLQNRFNIEKEIWWAFFSSWYFWNFCFWLAILTPVKISQNHKKIRSELQVVLERRTQANKHFLSWNWLNSKTRWGIVDSNLMNSPLLLLTNLTPYIEKLVKYKQTQKSH